MSDPYSDYMPEFSKPMTQGLYDAMRQAGDLHPGTMYFIAGPTTSSSWVRRVRHGIAYWLKERRELRAYARRGLS